MKDNKKKHQSTTSSAVSSYGVELGVVHIHENVIAAAVRKATANVEGVRRLAGNAIVNNIADLIGNKSISDRSIAVHIDGDSVAVEVKVNILYGVNVPTVATNIQTAVVEEVEKITGMNVTAVNVIVQELDDPEDEEKEEVIEDEV